MKTLHINTRNDYSIFIGHDLQHKLIDYCGSLKKRIVIISDDTVINLYAKELAAAFQDKNIAVELLSFPAGEQHKSRETKHHLEDVLFEKNIGRDACFIALGGGVVTDMIGFLAATYCRGVPVIYVPTTLLAMVDASIGGKTAINTPHGKNLIGTFTQPISVWIDTKYLKSLPTNEWYNGLVEMLKHGLIADKSFFTTLKDHVFHFKNATQEMLEHIIYMSCMIKRNIIEQDEQDSGMRKLLNFGHTIGHAIETLENYRISHGKAVAMGIIVESYMAKQLNLLNETAFNDIYTVFKNEALQISTTVFNNPSALYSLLKLDKKSIANIPHFVLLNDIGKPFLEENQYAFPLNALVIQDAIEWAHGVFSC